MNSSLTESNNSTHNHRQADPITANLVEIRIFYEKDHHVHWKDKVPDAYLPGYLSGDIARANVDKRIRQLYFKRPGSIVKIRWNFKGDSHGYWLIRSHEYDFSIVPKSGLVE